MTMLARIATSSVSLRGILSVMNREHTVGNASNHKHSNAAHTSQHKPALPSSRLTRAAHWHHVCQAPKF